MAGVSELEALFLGGVGNGGEVGETDDVDLFGHLRRQQVLLGQLYGLLQLLDVGQDHVRRGGVVGFHRAGLALLHCCELTLRLIGQLADVLVVVVVGHLVLLLT